MHQTLQTLLKPPVFADDEQTRIAGLLNTVCLALAAAAMVCGPIYLVSSPTWMAILPFVFLLFMAVWGIRLNRQGFTRHAAAAVSLSLFVVVTVGVVSFGGIGGPAYGGYVVCILVTGVLLGGKAGIGAAGLAIGIGWGLVNVGEAGLFEISMGPEAPDAMWAGMNSYFVATGLLLALADRNIHDTLERLRRTEKRFRDSEERYALATRGANDGIWDWNLRTDEVYYSPRWKEMVGLDPRKRETSSSAWLCRVHPDDRERVRAELEAHIAGISGHFESEHRLMHEDGAWRWWLSRGLAVRSDRTGKATRIAGSMSDITDRKTIEEQMEHAALHDALTRLPNRALFLDRLAQAIARSRRAGKVTFAVLFVDLDRFKVVNDSLGHLVGDQLLVAVARRIEGCLRPTDTAARLGGDEFAILLEDGKGQRNIEQVADRIQEKLGSTFRLDGRDVYITSSIGIAPGGPDYAEPDAILRDADMAMYKAKALGKARSERFDPCMRDNAVHLMELETDLRRAIDREELHVAYQPAIDIATGDIRGFEALVRWRHPERGSISPGEFIPMAEETGLIVDLDRFVLRRACQQLQAWRTLHHSATKARVAVNLSSRQFSRDDLVSHITDVLNETGLDPSGLTLEITESALMSNYAVVSANMRKLRDLGIDLAVDDFGTGYSSLGYLHRFPVQVLKIDRSFVNDMEHDRDKETIVRTVIRMADSLGLRVVAEGVETVEQVEALRRMKCSVVQGFLFSRPVDSETAGSYLGGNRPWLLQSAGASLAM